LCVFGSGGIEVKRHGTLFWWLIISRAEGIGRGETEKNSHRGHRAHRERGERVREKRRK